MAEPLLARRSRPDFHLTGDRQVNSPISPASPGVVLLPEGEHAWLHAGRARLQRRDREVQRQSCAILGASRDSLKAQDNFKAKQSFAFDLVSTATKRCATPLASSK